MVFERFVLTEISLKKKIGVKIARFLRGNKSALMKKLPAAAGMSPVELKTAMPKDKEEAVTKFIGFAGWIGMMLDAPRGQTAQLVWAETRPSHPSVKAALDIYGDTLDKDWWNKNNHTNFWAAVASDTSIQASHFTPYFKDVISRLKKNPDAFGTQLGLSPEDARGEADWIIKELK